MQVDHSNLMDITPVLRTLPASNKLGLALQPRRPRIFENCLGQCVVRRGGLSKEEQVCLSQCYYRARSSLPRALY